MEQAISDKMVVGTGRPTRRRGPKDDTGNVTREEVLPAAPPPGSRFKGDKDCMVRDLVVRVEVVRYRRECWLTPDGARSPHLCRQASGVTTVPICSASA